MSENQNFTVTVVDASAPAVVAEAPDKTPIKPVKGADNADT